MKARTGIDKNVPGTVQQGIIVAAKMRPINCGTQYRRLPARYELPNVGAGTILIGAEGRRSAPFEIDTDENKMYSIPIARSV